MTAPFHLGEDVADQLAATALAEHPEAWHVDWCRDCDGDRTCDTCGRS